MKNNNFYENIVNNGKGNIKKEDIEKAKKGDISGIMSSLSKSDADKIKSILNDKQKTKEILSSDAAKKFLEILGGK